jgi:ABC-type transport system involved in multi-copper enzyme maturation permease subunit
MSAPAAVVPQWPMWRNQALAIVWMELKKNFITKRGFWVYLLALAPAVVVWLHSIVTLQRGNVLGHDMSKDTQVLAVLFQVFFLRPALFFGCVGIFTYLFRGEVVERSLHYYFLSPVRRDVLVLAKFVAGAITAIFFFGGGIVLTFVGMYAHFAGSELNEFLLQGPGLGHLTSYVLITVLACIGWGSVCLWMGIRFRNPIIPSVTLLGWESANLFLPYWLRKLSVLHYLQSMVPVSGDFEGASMIFGVSADILPVWVSILAILAITVLMLGLSVRQLRRTEISYSSD